MGEKMKKQEIPKNKEFLVNLFIPCFGEFLVFLQGK